MENLEMLIPELLKLPRETQWLEFKHDNYNPEMIGRDISSLANGAALHDKEHAYFIWGIHNETHEIVGTQYNLQTLRKGAQELENWLRSLLSPHADFEYETVVIQQKTVGVLTIAAAMNYPVSFEKQDYIRIGSYTKALKEYPALQAKLWNKLQNRKFEDQLCLQDLSPEDILRLLRYEIYFDLLGIPRPISADSILHYFLEDNIVFKQDNGLYSITNLGAVLLARKLSDFPKVARKALRVVQYDGKNKYAILREETSNSGYAVIFEETMRFIGALLPSKEIIEDGIRKRQDTFPLLAVREIVANALIHQDFSISGTGPVVELFSNRLEVTNPGKPLVDIFRIVDTPPRSRNEKLSALMRRMGICEELGTGWDKIIIACELQQLPSPKMDIYEESTKVSLFSENRFSALTMDTRLWNCYLHACIKYLQGDYLTNSSLRTRFGLKDSSSGTISRLIKEAVDRQLIRPFDPETAPRYMKYVPIWG